MKNYLSVFIAVLCVVNAWSAPVLNIDNRYQVCLEINEPIPAELTAKQEMEEYLGKIFGQISADGKKYIFLRYDPQAGKEEFYIKNDNSGNVIISGGRPRGVLYGTYYLLDRILGVKWFTPDYEYVPRKKEIRVAGLNYHGKPAFNARILQTEPHGKNTLNGRRWRARNLFNSGFGGIFVTDSAYGEELIFSPPAQCHGLFRLVTPQKYYKAHPEFWALQNGKRTHRDKRGLTADYCLTNLELAETTVKECITYLRKNPTARYISIQEGDETLGFCECENCRQLVSQCGNCESARWVFFANQVGKSLKEIFPKVKVLIFAYTASRQPPENIQAEDNVCVQLCSWNNRRGMPYANQKNLIGNQLLEQLKKWKKVCRNILLWDYTYTFGDTLLQAPDLLLNIDNLRSFHEIGMDGIFTENGVPGDIAFGMPFKSWFIPRIMWNPDECGDGEYLEKIFCFGYYGEKAGAYIHEYYKLLRDTNRKQKFVNYTSGGVIGKADFEAANVTAKAYALLKQALAVEKEPSFQNRIKAVMLHIQYQILRDYVNVKKIGKVEESFDDIVSSMIEFISNDSKTAPHLKEKYIKNIKSFASLKGIKASASIVYANYLPAKAYDGDINTLWHAASGAGWCQIEFNEPQEIKRITTVLGTYRELYFGEYKISGSLDGIKWFEIIPRKKIEYKYPYRWVYADDQLDRAIKAKFIRTYRINAFMRNKQRNDVLLYEQWFNLTVLPKVLDQQEK